jgi:hypothetical protein
MIMATMKLKISTNLSSYRISLGFFSRASRILSSALERISCALLMVLGFAMSSMEKPESLRYDSTPGMNGYLTNSAYLETDELIELLSLSPPWTI